MLDKLRIRATPHPSALEISVEEQVGDLRCHEPSLNSQVKNILTVSFFQPSINISAVIPCTKILLVCLLILSNVMGSGAYAGQGGYAEQGG